ncbi:hypothetical protein FO519_002847 [Halicephalobus sp. NKZ332]|nr:hypothetical protein FO519_002847 [Halicephalobus sp. NKZ332]
MKETTGKLFKKNDQEERDPEDPTEFKTNWKSIFVITVVAFVGQLQAAAIIPQIWPYMQEINPSLSESLYGLLRGTWSLGIVLASTAAGYVSNKLENTNYAIMFGEIVSILSCVAYFCIELVENGQTAFLIVFELLFGISTGATGIYRAHVAMASSEKDRSKAVGISMFAPALGYVVGALLQSAFTTIKYPGVKLIFGIHLNLYTAPVIFNMILSIGAIILLATMFDGRMRVPPAEIEKQETEEVDQTPENVQYDKIAVGLMIATTLVFSFASLNLSTLIPVYMMAAFEWTSSQSVLYISVVLGASGVCFILFVAGYVFCKLGDRISPRVSLIVSIFFLFLFHVVTFQWPFINNSMVYKHPQGQPANTHFNQSLTFPGYSNDSLVGCNVEYKWCESTPVPNVILFMGSLIISVAVAVPLMNINGDILFSKILGPIKQGTLTGVYVSAGDFLNVVGPFLLTTMYTKTGPRYIWIMEIVLCAVLLLFWAVFYKRMIPYSEAQAKKTKSRASTTSVIIEKF